MDDVAEIKSDLELFADRLSEMEPRAALQVVHRLDRESRRLFVDYVRDSIYYGYQKTWKNTVTMETLFMVGDFVDWHSRSYVDWKPDEQRRCPIYWEPGCGPVVEEDRV